MNGTEIFKEKVLKEYGDSIAEKILKGSIENRKTTLRVNTSKANKEEIKQALDKEYIKYIDVEWYGDALIIDNANEQDIKNLSMYTEGKIYLQSLSSMIPPLIVEPKEGENILDMAAAPGGKTTQMANLSGQRAMITACEKNKIRSDRLKYNVEKQGARVNVMVEDARKLSEFLSFDKVLLDAPCSGSGTLNLNDANIDKYFNEELIKRSVKTQKELLEKAIKITKKGGEIIYSTCSILKEENESVINEVLKKGTVELIPINNEEINDIPRLPVLIEGTLCVMPCEKYEGFFVAKLRKV